MQPTAPRRLRKRLKLQRIERFFHDESSLRRVAKLPSPRIEIEANPIRLRKSARPAPSYMNRNASQVHHRDLRLRQSTHNIVRRFSRPTRIRNPLRRRSSWHALRLLLLIEATAAHPVRTSLQRQNPIFNE